MIKRIIKLLISMCFFIAHKCVRLTLHALKRQLPVSLVILYYHSVTTEQRSKFAHQMDELIKVTNPVFADIDKPLDNKKNNVAITFDDGFQNLLKNALPELCMRNIPATLFIPTGYLGKHPEWLINQSNKDYNELVMTPNELISLPTDLVIIGSHSVTHSDLTLLGEKKLLKELVKSKKDLEGILDKEINLLAFPYGMYNKKVLELSREAGYKRVFSGLPTFNSYNIDKFMIGRIDVTPDDWLIEYRLKIMGAYQWLPIAVFLKRKLRNNIRLIININRSN